MSKAQQIVTVATAAAVVGALAYSTWSGAKQAAEERRNRRCGELRDVWPQLLFGSLIIAGIIYAVYHPGENAHMLSELWLEAGSNYDTTNQCEIPVSLAKLRRLAVNSSYTRVYRTGVTNSDVNYTLQSLRCEGVPVYVGNQAVYRLDGCRTIVERDHPSPVQMHHVVVSCHSVSSGFREMDKDNAYKYRQAVWGSDCSVQYQLKAAAPSHEQVQEQGGLSITTIFGHTLGLLMTFGLTLACSPTDKRGLGALVFVGAGSVVIAVGLVSITLARWSLPYAASSEVVSWYAPSYLPDSFGTSGIGHSSSGDGTIEAVITTVINALILCIVVVVYILTAIAHWVFHAREFFRNPDEFYPQSIVLITPV